MKKIVFFVLGLTLIGLSFASCKKCSECVAKDKTTGVVVHSQEYCARRASLKVLENSFINTWGSSYDATCSSK